MIAMWDDAFCKMNPVIGDLLSADDGLRAFDVMHNELAKTWAEVYRLLVPGGMFCLNIGEHPRIQMVLLPVDAASYALIFCNFLALKLGRPMLCWPAE